uniref:Uncharacterized protein n=1 Tax=Cacopsylla melanoneura TaxID=428564 RepID=A0A8D9BP01_9HEMI
MMLIVYFTSNVSCLNVFISLFIISEMFICFCSFLVFVRIFELISTLIYFFSTFNIEICELSPSFLYTSIIFSLVTFLAITIISQDFSGPIFSTSISFRFRFQCRILTLVSGRVWCLFILRIDDQWRFVFS